MSMGTNDPCGMQEQTKFELIAMNKKNHLYPKTHWTLPKRRDLDASFCRVLLDLQFPPVT